MFVRTYSLTVTPAHCWLCRCVWRPELCYDRLSFSLPFSISCPLSSSLWWCVNWPQRHDPLSRIPRAIRQLFELRLENLSSWGSWHPSELSKKQFLVVMLDLAWDKEIFGCIIFFLIHGLIKCTVIVNSCLIGDTTSDLGKIFDQHMWTTITSWLLLKVFLSLIFKCKVVPYSLST